MPCNERRLGYQTLLGLKYADPNELCDSASSASDPERAMTKGGVLKVWWSHSVGQVCWEPQLNLKPAPFQNAETAGRATSMFGVGICGDPWNDTSLKPGAVQLDTQAVATAIQVIRGLHEAIGLHREI